MILEGLALSATLAFTAHASTAPAQVSLTAERQATIEEMRARHIISASADAWNPGDVDLLKRMQKAESSDAFSLLKRNVGSLQGLTVLHRVGSYRVRWLTKMGYERYALFRSQQARAFFEEQDVDEASIFQIKSVDGESIFDSQGLLSDAGDKLYDRILLGETIRWLGPTGQTMDNSPLRPETESK